LRRSFLYTCFSFVSSSLILPSLSAAPNNIINDFNHCFPLIWWCDYWSLTPWRSSRKESGDYIDEQGFEGKEILKGRDNMQRLDFSESSISKMYEARSRERRDDFYEGREKLSRRNILKTDQRRRDEEKKVDSCSFSRRSLLTAYM
jgi:hypothetical protein